MFALTGYTHRRASVLLPSTVHDSGTLRFCGFQSANVLSYDGCVPQQRKINSLSYSLPASSAHGVSSSHVTQEAAPNHFLFREE